MVRLLAALSVFATLLATFLAVDIGPLSLHRTRCLSNRMQNCGECYTKRRLAMCHRLALGKFHKNISWKARRREDVAASQAIIEEACDYLMDKDVDVPSITCEGFKSVFINEGSGLEVGGPPEVNGAGATAICVGVFVANGFSCAGATFIILRDSDGNAVAVVIIIILSPVCTPGIAIFNTAFTTLMNTVGFSSIFVNDPVIDFNPTGNSTLTIPFVSM